MALPTNDGGGTTLTPEAITAGVKQESLKAAQTTAANAKAAYDAAAAKVEKNPSQANVAALKNSYSRYTAAQAALPTISDTIAGAEATVSEINNLINQITGNITDVNNAGQAVAAITGTPWQQVQGPNKLNTSTPDTKQMDAITAISSLLSSYGIGDLAEPITNAVMKGYSSDTIELIMQDPNSSDPLAVAFQKRFPANKVRAAAGKPVLSPAEYLNAERTYSQIMKSYGVPGLGKKEVYSAFLASDVSATEVADRVGLAVDRVQNADANTKMALNTFFPMLNQGDIVAAMLNPEQSLPALKRKVQIAEIGGAAINQSLSASLNSSVADTAYKNVAGGSIGATQLAEFGVTKEQAQAGYASIADRMPRAEFLSSISQGEDYTQKQAEQEQFFGLASAKRAREQLSATEVGRFGGTSGVNKTSLTKGKGSF
jgi:hypothetical protein